MAAPNKRRLHCFEKHFPAELKTRSTLKSTKCKAGTDALNYPTFARPIHSKDHQLRFSYQMSFSQHIRSVKISFFYFENGATERKICLTGPVPTKMDLQFMTGTILLVANILVVWLMNAMLKEAGHGGRKQRWRTLKCLSFRHFVPPLRDIYDDGTTKLLCCNAKNGCHLFELPWVSVGSRARVFVCVCVWLRLFSSCNYTATVGNVRTVGWWGDF